MTVHNLNKVPTHQSIKPWWQICPLPEFKERILAMHKDELEAILAEVRGAISVIQSQIEVRKADREWWVRARHAQGILSERKRILVSEVHRRSSASWSLRDERVNKLLDLKEEVESETFKGDLKPIVLDLINLLIKWQER